MRVSLLDTLGDPYNNTRSVLFMNFSEIWKFHVNIVYTQVNPLCSCQSSIAVPIVGRRRLTLPLSGMAFLEYSIFIFIIFVPTSLIFSYFRLSIREILTESHRKAFNHAY